MIRDGRVQPGSEVTLAQSATAIAIRAGDPRPDISTPEALTRTLLAARRISYSDPAAGGASGIHFAKVLDRYGRVPEYMKRYEDEICVLVQVETREALAELDAIAGVEGVDGVFIGPSDLSASFGHLGNPQHDEVQQAILDAGARIKRAGKSAGFLTARDDEIRKVLGTGFGFVAVGSDVGLLARNAEGLVRTYKGAA